MRPHTLDEMSTIILIFCRDGANKIELIEKCYLNDIVLKNPPSQIKKMSCPFFIFIHHPIHLRADRISRIQLIISAFLFDQFIMCTTLNDSSLFQYHNAVRIADCR